MDRKSWKCSVAMAFHPNPHETLIQTHCGWIRVLPGKLGYQLNTGEFVEI